MFFIHLQVTPLALTQQDSILNQLLRFKVPSLWVKNSKSLYKPHVLR